MFMYFCRKVFLYLFVFYVLSYLLLWPSTPKVMFGLTTMLSSCRPVFGICLMSSFIWRFFRNFSGLLLLGSEGILLQISLIIPSSVPLFSIRSMSNPHRPLRFTATIMSGELNKFVSTDYNYGPLISSIHNIHSFFYVLLNFLLIASIYIKFMC